MPRKRNISEQTVNSTELSALEDPFRGSHLASDIIKAYPSPPESDLSPSDSPSAVYTTVFDIYQNERWWVGLGWVPNFLPGYSQHTSANFSDPPEYCDIDLNPIPVVKSGSAKEFLDSCPLPNKYPPGVARGMWRWRGDWRVEIVHNLTDEQGWSYANNSWTRWKKKSTLSRFTRRRVWKRTAEIVLYD